MDPLGIASAEISRRCGLSEGEKLMKEKLVKAIGEQTQ